MEFGSPLAGQMAVHIALMSAAAPAVAVGIRHIAPRRGAGRLRQGLVAATLVQTGLLWAWHAPGVLGSAVHSPTIHAVMQITLFAAALWFWNAVLDAAGSGRWRAISALLFTGKLFCLLGILLVFAPRVLYPAVAAAHAAGAGGGLPDQQLAGLLMIVACPLTYVLAGTVIAARWLDEIEAESRTASQFPQTGRFLPE